MSEKDKEAMADAIYCLAWHQLTHGQQFIVNAALSHSAAALAAKDAEIERLKQMVRIMEKNTDFDFDAALAAAQQEG